MNCSVGAARQTRAGGAVALPSASQAKFYLVRAFLDGFDLRPAEPAAALRK